MELSRYITVSHVSFHFMCYDCIMDRINASRLMFVFSVSLG